MVWADGSGKSACRRGAFHRVCHIFHVKAEVSGSLCIDPHFDLGFLEMQVGIAKDHSLGVFPYFHDLLDEIVHDEVAQPGYDILNQPQGRTWLASDALAHGGVGIWQNSAAESARRVVGLIAQHAKQPNTGVAAA